MAKKLEAKTESRIPSEGQYLKFRKAMKSAKAEMDEAKGTMGSLKEKAVADYNVHSDADRIASRYANKSPAQQSEFLFHFSQYWDYLKLAGPETDLVETPAERKASAPKKRGRPKKAQPEVIEGEKDIGPSTRPIRGGCGLGATDP